MPASPGKQWYYAKARQRLGPVSAHALAQMYQKGDLLDGDLVWCAPMPQWRRAEDVKNQFLTAAPSAGSTADSDQETSLTPLPSAVPYSSPLDALPAIRSSAAGETSRSVREDSFEYGGFFARFAALILDLIILSIIQGVVIGLVIAAMGTPASEAGKGPGGPFLPLLSVAITWLYYALQESGRHCATFGKRTLGLAVTDLHGNGITFGRATARHFSKIISSAICLVGYFFVFFTARKQALHDIIAGCMIIK